MKLIYEGAGGVAAIVTPAPAMLAALSGTEEEQMAALADKILPAGTKYEIVQDDDIPTNREHRAGWTYIAGINEKTAGGQ